MTNVGIVELECGHVERARAVFERALERVDDDEIADANRQTMLCALALASLHERNLPEAERLRAEAGALDGRGYYVDSLKTAIATVAAGGDPARYLRADFG